MADFDPDDYRLQPGDKPSLGKSHRPPRHRAGEKFLKGPIPLSWLSRALKEGRPALATALVLWYLAGLKRTRIVTPTWRSWQLFDVPPDTGRRGVAALEKAGLILVDRHRGRCPVITIQKVTSERT